MGQKGLSTIVIVGIVVAGLIVVAGIAVVTLKGGLGSSTTTTTSPTIPTTTTTTTSTTNWFTFAEGKYVFVNIWNNKHGEIIEGNRDAFGFEYIDFPTYTFSDGRLGILNSPPDNFFMVVGEGASLSGDAGSGAASGVSFVDSIPYNWDNNVVTSLSLDGTISLTYGEMNLTLAHGENFENVTTWTENKLWNGELCVMRYTNTFTIVNYGIQNKDNIFTI